MLIDTHCHLNYDYAPRSLEDILKSCEDAEISHLVTIGTDIPSISAVQKISDHYPHVFHTIGVHPHEASIQLSSDDLQILRSAAGHPKCRAIVEIGLDYYYKHASPNDQQVALKLQLDLAIELSLPIIVHSRDAEEDLLPFLKTFSEQFKLLSIYSELNAVGIIHCFTGTKKFSQACLELGFLISFSGILTFKNAEALREIAQSTPLDSLLVETDSPFLAPAPFRGKKCEPHMVRQTALKLAEIKGITLKEVEAKTTQSAKRFFRITN